MKSFFSVFVLGIIFLLNTQTSFAAPSISNITDNRSSYPSNQIPKYEKIESTFVVNNTVAQKYQHPYDPNPPQEVIPSQGISVDAVFTAPNGQSYQQPAFYFVGYADGGLKSSWSNDGSQLLSFEWYYPNGQNSWKIRFAPDQVGGWQYYLKVTDASGTFQTNPQSFAVTDSSNHGFIKVSPLDARYFIFSDGTYFNPNGLEHQLVTDNPVTDNDASLAPLTQAGIHLIRSWHSGLFGSSWLEWLGGRGIYDGYLPRAGLESFHDPVSGNNQLTLALRPTTPSGWYDGCRFDAQNGSISIKPNTNYRLQIRYQASCIAGPENSSNPNYGVVGIISNPFDWPSSCDEPYSIGDSRVITNFGGNTNGWQTVTGSWNSGSLNFLPRVALGINNVLANSSCVGINGQTGAKAWIDSISLKEILTGGQSGVEVLPEPSMQYDSYFKDYQANRLDKAIEQAEKNHIYLKMELMEKNDMIWLKLDNDGTYVFGNESDNITGIYGSWRNFNKTRWLQQAYFRYLQARWGYSTAIHSWEAMNEGDPFNGSHYVLTDEMSKYFHCGVFGQFIGSSGTDQHLDGQLCTYSHPNAHLVTTSFWHSFVSYDPSQNLGWANPNFPNLQYADVHDYIQKPSEPNHYFDTALATYDLGQAYGAKQPGGANMPVMRGETGLIIDDGTDAVSTELDSQGVWLHNFIWGSINPFGLTDIWWHVSQMYSGSNDLRPLYKHYDDFMKNISLGNGKYQDALATATDTNIRVWGQKDSVGQSASHAHLWVQNKKHLWCAVRGNVSGCPVANWDASRLNGTVTITGFTPNNSFPIEWWNFDNNVVLTKQTGTVSSNGSGQIVLDVASLPATVTDTGVKIGDYAVVTPTPVPSPTVQPSPTPSYTIPELKTLLSNWLTSLDTNYFSPDGKINALDASWIIKYLE